MLRELFDKMCALDSSLCFADSSIVPGRSFRFFHCTAGYVMRENAPANGMFVYFSSFLNWAFMALQKVHAFVKLEFI